MAWLVTPQPESTIEIRGEISTEDFASFRAVALTKLNAKTSLPGFRPGHIPEATLVSQLGESAVLEEMARLAVAKIYPELIKEHKIDALGSPQITITKIAKDNPLGLVIKTAVLPKIELGDYRERLKPIAAKKPERDQKRLEILEELVKTTPFDLPVILIESEIERVFGSSLSAGKRAEVRPEIEKRIRIHLLFDAIANQEKLTTPEEVWQNMEKI